MTTLRYLVFDVSLDDEGGASLDASASVTEALWPALVAEVQTVLAWAEREFPGQRGPGEEGGTWDVDLQGSEEVSQPLNLEWTPPRLSWQQQAAEKPLRRRTLHLSLRGNAAFVEAFESAFESNS